MAPASWDLLEGVEGTLYINGDRATFVGPGAELSFETGGLDRLHCRLE